MCKHDRTGTINHSSFDMRRWGRNYGRDNNRTMNNSQSSCTARYTRSALCIHKNNVDNNYNRRPLLAKCFIFGAPSCCTRLLLRLEWRLNVSTSSSFDEEPSELEKAIETDWTWVAGASIHVLFKVPMVFYWVVIVQYWYAVPSLRKA